MKVKQSLQLLGLGALLGLSAILWLQHRHNGALLDGTSSPHAALPKDDKEQVIVNPHKHTITIVQPNHTTVTHLPDRESVIDIRKDGRVVVTTPQYGFEALPYAAVGVSDKLRIGMGVDFFYWKRLDLSTGFQIRLDSQDPRLYVGMSYNIYSNLRLGVTIDHRKMIGAMLSVRI